MPTSDNFTVIRLILAMMVIYSHSYAVTGYIEPTLLGRSYGNLAVHGFFVLSGFLVTESYLRTNSLPSFSIKRLFRILPALIPAHFFARSLFHYFNSYASNPYPGLVNGPLWTLRWEGLMYAAVGIFGVLQLLDRKFVASCLVFGLLLVLTKIGTNNDAVEVVAPLVLLFTAGGLIRLSQDHLDLKKFGIASAVILVLLFAPGISDHVWKVLKRMSWSWGPTLDFYQFRFFPYIIAFSFFMVFVARHFFFSLKIEKDISYGVYIFGWPVQQSLVALLMSFNFTLHPIAVFVISASVSAIIAMASWTLVEKPSIEWGRRLAARVGSSSRSLPS